MGTHNLLFRDGRWVCSRCGQSWGNQPFSLQGCLMVPGLPK